MVLTLNSRRAPTPRPYLYLPDGWNTAWQAAKAAAGSSPAIVTGIGDSFMHGAYATDWHLTGWFGQLKTRLAAAGYGLHGDFWPVSSNIVRNSGITGTIPFVVSSSGIFWAYNGLGEVPYYAGANGGSVTFTTPYACTDIDIVYIDSSQGGTSSWKYAVDGGGAVTVNTTGNDAVKRVQLTGLANTTHTIVCDQQAGSFAMMICGAVTYASRTAGIGYGRVAYQGAAADQYGNTGNHPANRPLLFQGAAAGAGPLDTLPVRPHLAFIGLGVNDNTAGNGLEGYRATLRRICQALRRGRDGCSIIFVINSVANGVNSDQTSNYFGNPTQWPLYVQAQWQVAREYNAAVVDFNAKWGQTAVAQGFTALAQGHPTQAGHDDMATTIYAVL